VLPKQFRLSNKDFITVKKQGRKIFGPLFGLLIIQEKQELENRPKFGFIVSKKIDKRATVRNKIKRRLDQALLPFLPKIKPEVMVVFLARKTLVDKSFLAINKEIERMLNKAKLLQ